MRICFVAATKQYSFNNFPASPPLTEPISAPCQRTGTRLQTLLEQRTHVHVKRSFRKRANIFYDGSKDPLWETGPSATLWFHTKTKQSRFEAPHWPYPLFEWRMACRHLPRWPASSSGALAPALPRPRSGGTSSDWTPLGAGPWVSWCPGSVFFFFVG